MGRSAHLANRERRAVCGRQQVVYCIVRAVMKCLTEREEVAIVRTKLQNVELHDTGRRYCDQRG